MASPRILAVVFLFFTQFAPYLFAKEKWTPMTPEEKAMTDSSIEPGAGAEIIWFKVVIDDVTGTAEYKTQLRVKILNQKGAEEFLSYKIEYDENTSVSRIEGRVYKPDGTELVIDKKCVFDQQISRDDNTKVRAKTVAVPGLEAGCVIELNWTKDDTVAWLFSMQFQYDFPARLVRYDFQRYEGLGFQSYMVNYKGPAPKEEKDGRYVLEMTNVKSYRREPYSLPDIQTRSWLFIWYTRDTSESPKEHWQTEAERLNEQVVARCKPKKDIATMAQQVTAGAATTEEKLRKLHDFCRSEIRDTAMRFSKATEKEKKSIDSDSTASDTLKRRYGTRSDINRLFVAMAKAIGVDARLAAAGDRNGIVPRFSAYHSIFLGYPFVAIPNEGGKWSFTDPGSVFLPYGMVRPECEGLDALLSDPKDMRVERVEVSPAPESEKRRVGQMTITSEGELSGTISCSFTGIQSYYQKNELEGLTLEEQQELVKKDALSYLPNAEITDIRVAGASSALEPLAISFNFRIPQYGERTGSRLIFQPMVFQKNDAARFTSDIRTQNLYFSGQYTTEDEIRINIPAGFVCEEPSSPRPVSIPGFVEYKPSIGLSKKGDYMISRRKFTQNSRIISPDKYELVKRIFDTIHREDNHSMSLRESAEAPAGESMPAVPPASAAPTP